jgi:serralysin
LTGGNGRDVLTGGAGNDIIDGKSGKDIITTGTGNDTIIFDTALGKNNVDKVTDFSDTNDVIALSRFTFADAGPIGVLSADAFFTGSAAHDATDRIIYNSVSGALSYDPGGTASGSSTQFATLSPGLHLTNLNFKIV